MRAQVGDHIVIAAHTTGGKIRDGEVVEVRGGAGSPPYLVRWSDDGSTGLYFPGNDAQLNPAHLPEPTAESHPRTEPLPVRSWRVDISLYETGDETTAHAVLVSEAAQHLDVEGGARRNPSDVPVPEIGEEIAVARALRRLSDRLFAAASTGIKSTQGQPASIVR